MTDVALTNAEKTAPVDFNARFVFDLLERQQIRYALIRGYYELFESSDAMEIDLLVHPDDLAAFRVAVAEADFAESPAWGYEPHHFFVAFERESSCWIKLDVVTRLSCGRPIRKYPVDLGDAPWHGLRRKQVNLLAYEHEFIALLSHCLLDKSHFDDKHKRRLRELFNLACENNAIETAMREQVRRNFEPVLAFDALIGAIKQGEWQKLESYCEGLTRHFAARYGLAGRWYEWRILLRRRLRPLLFAWQRRGLFIALLAPDGAGKSTLASRLAADRHMKAKLIYMGTNLDARNVGLPTTPVLTRLTRAVNKRNRRKTPAGIAIRALNLANSLLDHWYRCLLARYHVLRGRIVVFDRYIYDSWIQKKKNTPWKRLRRLLFEGLAPPTHLVVLLDAPAETLFARKGEHSPEWIERQRAGYRKLQPQLRQMVIVDASRTADEVKAAVTELIWDRYRSQNCNGSRRGS